MNTTNRSRADFGALVLVLAMAWEGAHFMSRNEALPSPLATMDAIRRLILRPDFAGNVEATLYALGLSIVISMLGGLTVGILLGIGRRAGILMEPILVSLYSLPKVTLYPLVLLIFGLGIPAKVAFGAMHGFIPVVLVTMNAIRQIRPVHIRTARVMRLSSWDCLTKIVLPATLPEIVAALRLGFSLSLLGVVIGEMFASKQGFGFMVMTAIGLYDLPTILAITVCLATFAIVVNSLLLWLGRHFRHLG
jgi:NitT/TauT family transport system permease protein